MGSRGRSQTARRPNQHGSTMLVNRRACPPIGMGGSGHLIMEWPIRSHRSTRCRSSGRVMWQRHVVYRWLNDRAAAVVALSAKESVKEKQPQPRSTGCMMRRSSGWALLWQPS